MKLKCIFFCIVPLHCSKFYKCFLLLVCCAQGCHFFVIPSVQTGAPESRLVKRGSKAYKKTSYVKKNSLFIKKKFYRIAILYRDRFQHILYI